MGSTSFRLGETTPVAAFPPTTSKSPTVRHRQPARVDASLAPFPGEHGAGIQAS
jgi:hypothetical protein